ncbi:hypothetical protein QUW11_03530 [Mediterranea massiliensis]|nr:MULTISPECIES: hypothetical protein [Mediterranea]MCL1608887.1 hypothetical protein [Mediterranea sp. ET5]MDM8122153.1 hypothetical protein [Mediterranea massiliensis]MDM8197611.1 hypothetical protein [Mediterranea massiliensis]
MTTTMPVPVQMSQRGVSAHNRQPFRLFFLFLFFFPAVTDRTFRREEEDAELRFTLRVLRTGLLTASIGVLDTITYYILQENADFRISFISGNLRSFLFATAKLISFF